MAYQLLIFDFDGTLADSLPFFLEVFDILAARHGFRPIARDDLATLRTYDTRQLMRHVGLPAWKSVRVAADFRSLMAQNIERIHPFDGVEAMLLELAAQGVTLALMSSNSLENVRAVLGPRSMALFTHLECGVSLFGKGHKLRRLLAASGVAPARVLCVGDEVRDMEAARGAGLDFGGVGWGYATPESLRARQPTRMFLTVAQLALVNQAPA